MPLFGPVIDDFAEYMNKTGKMSNEDLALYKKVRRKETFIVSLVFGMFVGAGIYLLFKWIFLS